MGSVNTLMEKFVQWLDPKLEKYRPKKPEPKKPEPEMFMPKTLEDFIFVLKKMPKEELSDDDRRRISAAMTFSSKKVRSVMTKKKDIVFVYEHDFLGPVMLDKLYKSGFSHFPVMSGDGSKICGILHTRALNTLEIKETDKAIKFVDPHVYYLADYYTLEEALAAFARTASNFMMVTNHSGEVVGLLSFTELVKQLLGHLDEDDFDQDHNRYAVAKRR